MQIVKSKFVILQWCYWAHNGSEYPTTSHKGGGERREATVWGFEWRKSSTRCGLHMPEVTEAAGGEWKCHLANTDSRELEKIRSVWGQLYNSLSSRQLKARGLSN